MAGAWEACHHRPSRRSWLATSVHVRGAACCLCDETLFAWDGVTVRVFTWYASPLERTREDGVDIEADADVWCRWGVDESSGKGGGSKV